MRHRPIVVAGACLAAVLVFSPASAARQQQQPAQEQEEQRQPPPPPPIPSTTGMVVSVNGIASDIGAATLARGGNAVDAAVATAFALAVVHPAAGNLGGGGFMVVRTPGGVATTFDYREKAPLKSTRTMYLDSAGKIVRERTRTGYLAPGVPGTVKGLALAHKRFGKLPWKDVVLPAADLAEQGFVLSRALARSIQREVDSNMTDYPQSVKAYGKPNGEKWAEGDTLVQRDLGRAIRSIATEGPSAFYIGWIADSIAATMKSGGGLITKKDLAAYSAKERAPVRGKYRGYDIIGMAPPSSGGIAVIEMLNILERYDLGGMGRESAEAQHLIIEAQRRAYLDRARFVGDPDFVTVPVAKLTSKIHARNVASTIKMDQASSSALLGKDILSKPMPAESDQTTHFSVIDKDGMAVSSTYTLEGSYGSHVVVSGAGFLLNNEMGDFNKKPGYTDSTGIIGTRANLIAPGKRMLSSMTPTIVVKDGQPFLITGSPGGRTIINTTLMVILNTIDFKMNVREAVSTPREDFQWMPDSVRYEAGALTDSLYDALRAMGHKIAIRRSPWGDANSIRYDALTRTAWGANDHRMPDGKVSKP